MIDFFQKGATMTKRIEGTARLAHAPEVKSRPRWNVGGIGRFMDGDTCVVKILTEIADTAEARRVGLMGCEKIPDIVGMVFEGLSDGGYFWMKDCLVPIDVAFMDKDGTITKLYRMKVEPDGGTHYRYDADDVAAVEVRGGFLDDHQIRVGFKFAVERLKKESKHG